MNKMTLTGIILIVLAVVAFVFQGISYTTREKAVDLGPVQVSTEKTEKIPLPPVVGAVALACGIVFLVLGSKKSNLIIHD